MRIGIDARSLVGNPSGVGTYLAGVLSSDEFDFDVICYDGRSEARPSTAHPFPSRSVSVPSPVYRLLGPATPAWWMNVTLPRAISCDGVSCFLGPNFVKPLTCPTPSVIVVHDLVHRIHPETHSVAYRWYLRTFLPRSVRSADHVVVVSESTKCDLQRFHGIDDDRITVAYPAAAPRFRPRDVSDSERGRLRRAYDLPSEFILFVGNVEPRKNLATLARAVRMLPDSVRLPLVVVGQDHVPDPAFRSLLSEEWAEDLIFRPGYVPHEDLPLLYNLASAFVYPSIYEGFGIPPLEAMQSGTPVVTSNRSALPEVVGDAGLTVDPTDVRALSEVLGRLLDDDTVADEYRRRGIERAKQFSWDVTARAVGTAIDEAIGGP